jgi:hypothetical protein
MTISNLFPRANGSAQNARHGSLRDIRAKRMPRFPPNHADEANALPIAAFIGYPDQGAGASAGSRENPCQPRN